MNVSSNQVTNSDRHENSADNETSQHPLEAPPPYTFSESVNVQPVIHQTIIVQAPLKDTPVFYNCPKCDKRVFTKVEHVSSKNTHFLAGFVFGLTMWCLLCCLAAIPYYVRGCKKTLHYCPDCDTLLGTY